MINHPEIILPLLVGFLIDCLIGDPHWLPHPIRAFGNAIAYGEKILNRGKRKKLYGGLLSIGLVLLTFLLFWGGIKLLTGFKTIKMVVMAVFVFYGLANRSLIHESWRVVKVLNKEGIEAGRKQLSMIVGRDTTKLDENQIRRAVLETLAENLSDGVIAPLFYYGLGGVPAMMAYKMGNTLDSMIGYKNERYKDFGFFAAKFDDVLNFIPARLTALIMVLITWSWRGLKFIFKYGRKHSSPNAGYPEAALAGILNCRFGGPNIYHGVLVEKPFIGEKERTFVNGDIKKAGIVNLLTTLFVMLLIVLIYIN